MGFDHFQAVRLAPLRFEASGNDLRYSVSIPGVLQMSSTKRVDQDLKPASPVAALDIWGNRIQYATDIVHRYRDPISGVGWDWSKRQSNHKRFTTTLQQYLRGEIGWGNYDGSGRNVWSCPSCSPQSAAIEKEIEP